jgi:hypothetical protein
MKDNEGPWVVLEEAVVLVCGVVIFYGFDLLVAVLRG